jgi:Secretion system C-terminal sorting domain
MKKLLTLILAVVLLGHSVNAQLLPANYTMAPTSGTYVAIAGTSVPLLAATNYNVGSISLGFTFYYMGNAYTMCNVSTSGFISFSANPIGSTGYTNNVMSGTPFGNMIAPLWDGLGLVTFGTDVIYTTTGTVGSQIFTVQWSNVKWANAAGGPCINFQVQLEEGTNKIKFVYQTSASALSGAGASVGLIHSSTGNSGTSVASVIDNVGATITVGQKFASLNNIGIAPTVSSSTETNNIATKPADGQTFTFTPNATVATAATGATATTAGSAAINTTWIAGTNNLQRLEWGTTSGGPYTGVANFTNNKSSYLITSGLTPATTYYFKITSFVEGGASVSSSEFSATTNPIGTVAATATGNWGNPATWGGVILGPADNATIDGGFTVTLDQDATINDVKVGGTLAGTLDMNALGFLLTISGNTTVTANGTITAGTGATGSNSLLNFAKNIINDGIVDLATGGTPGTPTRTVSVTFSGTTAQTWTGTGTNDFHALTINKGTGTVTATSPTIDIQSNFTIRDQSTSTYTSFITTTTWKGILKLSPPSAAISMTPYATAANIGTTSGTGGLWLNSSFVTFAAQAGSPNLYGLLRITHGTYNLGTAAGQSLGVQASATFIMEGGSMNVAGRFGVAAAANAFNFTMSGGIMTVNTQGNVSTTLTSFDMGTSTTSKFTMSGGTIIISKAGTNAGGTAVSGYDVRGLSLSASALNVSITGGTIQIGSASTLASPLNAYTIRGGYLPSVTVNSTNNPTVALNGNIVVGGDLTLAGSGTFTYGIGDIDMRGGNATNTGNISNSGMTLTTGAGGTRVLIFSSSFGNQSYSQTSGTLGNIPNLTISNTATGGTVSFGSAAAINNTSSSATPLLKLLTGTLNGTNLTIGNSGTGGYTVEVTNGVLTGTPTYSFLGSGGRVVRYLKNSTTTLTVGKEWPSTPLFGALEIYSNNSTGTTDITLDADRNITGTLKLGNISGETAILRTGAFTLTIGTSAAVTGGVTLAASTTTRVIGNLKRWIATTATSYTFPMATLTTSRSATINFAAGAPTTGGTLTASFTASSPGVRNVPAMISGQLIEAISPTGFWTIAAADGLAGGTYTGTFDATGFTDPYGNPPSGLTGLRMLKGATGGSVYSDAAATAPTNLNSVAITGMTGFSDFALGGTAVALTVEFTTINAQAKGTTNELNFATATEKDVKEFAIERSINNKMWEVIGTKAAIGGSSAANYNFTDVNPSTLSYYRVRSIETNGKGQISKVVAVKRNGGKLALVAVSPVPTTEGVNVDFSIGKTNKVSVTVTDILGKVVKTETFRTTEGANTIRLNLSNLAQGTYIMTLNDGETMATQRIVKN